MSISTPVLHGPVLEDRAGAGCGQEIPRQAPGAAGEVAHGTAESRSSCVMLQVRPPRHHAAAGQEGGQEVETLQGAARCSAARCSAARCSAARCSAARGHHPSPCGEHEGGCGGQPGAPAPGRHGHPAPRARLQRAEAAGAGHQVSCSPAPVSCTCTCPGTAC